MLEVKELDAFTKEQRYNLECAHLSKSMYKMNKIKEEYEEFLSREDKSIVDMENYSFLATLVLSKLGYPMNAFGTYLYVEEIVAIIERMNEQKNMNTNTFFYKMKKDIEKPYSTFYNEVIKEKLDMRSADFHGHIKEAIFNIDCNKRNKKFADILYKDVNQALDPVENAFVIAHYISSASKKAKMGSLKVKQYN